MFINCILSKYWSLTILCVISQVVVCTEPWVSCLLFWNANKQALGKPSTCLSRTQSRTCPTGCWTWNNRACGTKLGAITCWMGEHISIKSTSARMEVLWQSEALSRSSITSYYKGWDIKMNRYTKWYRNSWIKANGNNWSTNFKTYSSKKIEINGKIYLINSIVASRLFWT